MKTKQSNESSHNSNQSEINLQTVIVRSSSGFITITGNFKGDGTEFLIIQYNKKVMEVHSHSIPEFVKRSGEKKDDPDIKAIIDHLQNKATSQTIPILYTNARKTKTTLAVGIFTSNK